MKDDNEVVWLQLTAGQGPKECGWVVAKLCQRIMQAATRESIAIEIVETLAYDKELRKQNLIEPDAYLSMLLRLEGEMAVSFSKCWHGSIKWCGESPFRKKHKRINWFVGVILMEAPEDKKSLDSMNLSQEVDFECMRASGAGGQHVNKTNSAVRLTHRPTGIKIRVETDRSQHRNKKIALERLQLLIENEEEGVIKRNEKDRWLNHYHVNRGSPSKVFCGLDFTER